MTTRHNAAQLAAVTAMAYPRTKRDTTATPPMECCHADTCLSDYWGGHHLPHVQIAAWPGMTMAQIKQAIRSEISQGAIMGSTDDARLLCADMVDPGEERRADMLTRRAYAAIARMKPARKNQRRFFMDLDPQDDDTETAYAFFVFRTLEA
jgi:hypothetical protein